MQEYFLKSYIETRAVEIANYIVENNATVRQAAKKPVSIRDILVHSGFTDAKLLCSLTHRGMENMPHSVGSISAQLLLPVLPRPGVYF